MNISIHGGYIENPENCNTVKISSRNIQFINVKAKLYISAMINTKTHKFDKITTYYY